MKTHKRNRDNPRNFGNRHKTNQNTKGVWKPAPLSGEGVAISHFVVARRLVSRHRSEFGTLRTLRFCGLEALGLGILGVLKSLQKGRAALRSCLRARRRARKPFGKEAKGSEAVWEGGEGLGSRLGRRRRARKLFEAVRGGGAALGSCLEARRCARKLFGGEALRSQAVRRRARAARARFVPPAARHRSGRLGSFLRKLASET